MSDVIAGFRAGLSSFPGAEHKLSKVIIFVIGAGFLVSPEPLWADFFYVGVLPFAVWGWGRHRKGGEVSRLPAVLKVASLLVLWFGVCLAWDADALAHPGHLVLWLLNLLCCFVFVHVLYAALDGDIRMRHRLVTTMLVGGFLNIVVTFVRFPFHQAVMWSNGQLRMSGWAETRHPILGAALMGVVVLFSLSRAMESGRARYWGLAALGLVFIAMTGSRGPEIAVFFGVAVLLGFGRPRLFLGLGAAGLVVLAGVMLVDWPLVHGVVSGQMARGDSHRFAIWAQSWRDICQRPLLGHGPGYRLARDASESFPHNLFLSTWLYGGLIGLGLLVAYLLAVFVRVLGGRGRTEPARLKPAQLERALALGLMVEVIFNALTDFGQVIRAPSLMWYVFWLPTLFAATIGTRPVHHR